MRRDECINQVLLISRKNKDLVVPSHPNPGVYFSPPNPESVCKEDTGGFLSCSGRCLAFLAANVLNYLRDNIFSKIGNFFIYLCNSSACFSNSQYRLMAHLKRFEMKTLRILLLIVLVLLVIPLVSWIMWKAGPSKGLDVLIVDKSVMDAKRTEHLALVWSLNHNKFLKSDKKSYSIEQDYYGFLPLKPYKGRNFEVKRIRLTEIDQLAESNDVLYFADTYGVYFNEWFSGKKKESGSNQIIGGLNQNDFLLISKMMDKGKLIIAEHNFFSLNTEPLVKRKTEELLNLRNTGWTGKYFSKLDTSSRQVPAWIISTYKHLNGGQWPFRGPGIVLAKGVSSVLVLQEGTDLTGSVPMLRTASDKALEYGLPDSIGFSNWFDITFSDTLNQVFSEFSLPVNENGLEKLTKENISPIFPAVLHYKGNYEFWYFGGDFSEIKMPYATYKLKGWTSFNFFRSSASDNQRAFVWKYFIPLTSKILNDVK
jgi:hypothetical protein